MFLWNVSQESDANPLYDAFHTLRGIAEDRVRISILETCISKLLNLRDVQALSTLHNEQIDIGVHSIQVSASLFSYDL